jgi:hypothetical protein
MKKIKLILAASFLAISGITAVQSCKKADGCGESNISKSGGDDSHNNGQNCMSCHVSGGDGEGCFNAAGSVYTGSGAAFGAGTVKLHTAPNGAGSVVATIQVDSKGNFYTTESINFSGGVYPSFSDGKGNTKYMGSSIGSAQCNSCHGSSTGKITAP